LNGKSESVLGAGTLYIIHTEEAEFLAKMKDVQMDYQKGAEA